MNEHLLPQIIIDLVDKFKAASNPNEFMSYEDRLKVIVAYCQAALDGKSANKVNDAFLSQFKRKKN